jgi:proteasome lid subunit RPN8/RPN11
MTETTPETGALVTWSAPQCPIVIEYSRKALDDIRLAVVDAFFSLPRGGAEIGGLLLGKFEDQRLQILDYAPLECEHAFGPAFTLSPKDQARLAERLAETQNRPGDLKPVGWYHSHTRSEIALCDADLEIQNRYFPERWQVALVLRPSTLQPTQAGFFCRELDGTMHGQNSYREFTLEALPVRQLPTGAPAAVPGPIRETEPDAVVIMMPAAEPAAHEENDHVMEPAQPAVHESHEPAPVAEAAPIAEAAPMAEVTEFPPPPIAQFSPEPLPEPVAVPSFANETRHPEEVESRAAENHNLESYPVESAHPADHQEAPLNFQPAAYSEPARVPFEDTEAESPKQPRKWAGIAVGLAAGLALGVLADQARSHRNVQAEAATAPPVVRTAQPAVPSAGNTPSPELQQLRLRNEDLAKQNAALSQENAGLHQANADLGKQQADRNARQSGTDKQQADLRQQRDDLVRLNNKLKADLTTQTARTQTVQQQLDDLRRQQQRRRLSVQSTDPLN